MEKILITGGAGFVGSNLALEFKRTNQNAKVIAFDNLKRRGSELNLNRFKKAGVEFVHGDVRTAYDLDSIGGADLVIDCAAEPSVMAGANSDPSYVIDTNLNGTINTLEFVRKSKAALVFLSTSRVYPIEPLNKIKFDELSTRFNFTTDKSYSYPKGCSEKGIAEDFSLSGVRSLYGSSKLASEYFVQEYIDAYKIKAIINRCGVLTGPWQMGKTDQGVIVLWAAQHFFKGALSYFGFGGSGKQLRDILHVQDLFTLLQKQLPMIDKINGDIFNVGGGQKVSTSLCELTNICQELSGNSIKIGSVSETRYNDIQAYVTDNTKVTSITGWEPQLTVTDIMRDIFSWIESNKESLSTILA